MMPRPCLVLADRIELQAALAADPVATLGVLADVLGVAVSTVCRELARNGGRDTYAATRAQDRADRCRCRPKQALSATSVLGARIAKDLGDKRSPASIARQLTTEGGQGVSAETIYQAVYAGRLGVDPTVVLHLKRRRRRRRHHTFTTNRSGNYLGDFQAIADRPQVKGIPGHWEGDLITGAGSRSHIISLYEPFTKYTVILPIDNGSKASKVVVGILADWAASLPGVMAQSLTWDRGAELAHWTTLTDLFISGVFFADVRAPWQRGGIETNNAHIRDWFPRTGTMIDATGQRAHQAMHILNTERRRSINWATPQELYDHVCTHH